MDRSLLFLAFVLILLFLSSMLRFFTSAPSSSFVPSTPKRNSSFLPVIYVPTVPDYCSTFYLKN